MKRIITISILLMTTIGAFAQSKNDSMEIRKYFGKTFHRNGKKLSTAKLLDITKSNPEAYKEMKTASNWQIGVLVLRISGGFLVSVPVITTFSGGNPNWNLAFIGAELVAISIPFSIAYSKHAKNAVRIYNDGLKQTGRNNLDLKLGFTDNGIGIKLKL